MVTLSRKFNLGAGQGWKRDGWEALDHSNLSLFRLKSQAWDLPYTDESFDIVFTSHMIEHISHLIIEEVICEINRVMAPGGILRILTPDLKKLATAYINNDIETMDLYIQEDGSGIKRELGLGQAFMNFICSCGIDNFLFTNDYSRVIGGYGHVYCYDFEMFSGLLKRYGFNNIRQCDIEESEIEEHRFLRGGPYNKDQNHSLIVECKKEVYVPYSEEKSVLHTGPYKINNLRPGRFRARTIAFQIIGHIWNIRCLAIQQVLRLKAGRING